MQKARKIIDDLWLTCERIGVYQNVYILFRNEQAHKMGVKNMVFHFRRNMIDVQSQIKTKGTCKNISLFFNNTTTSKGIHKVKIVKQRTQHKR